MKPEMTEVDSSWIRSLGYDEDQEELWVELSNGKTYVYEGVSLEVYEALKEADSVGRFFIKEIKGNPDYGRRQEE